MIMNARLKQGENCKCSKLFGKLSGRNRTSEAFVNIIIELLEIDIQELFLGKELAKQFPEPLLVFIRN